LPVQTHKSDSAKANVVALIGGKGLLKKHGYSRNFLMKNKEHLSGSNPNFTCSQIDQMLKLLVINSAQVKSMHQVSLTLYKTSQNEIPCLHLVSGQAEELLMLPISQGTTLS